MAFAAARALMEYMAQARVPGRVIIYGTPAEEVDPPAKGIMWRAGVFKGADILVRSHSSVETRRDRPGFGVCCLNIDAVKYTFTGRPAHQLTAWNGRNALEAAFGPAETPIYYVPFRQVPLFVDAVVVRTTVPPLSLASTVRAAVAEIDNGVAVHHLGPLTELQAEMIAIPGVLALLLGVFAAIALLLAAIGLYGLLSHSVARRTNEIGVRLALGATRADVLAMVMRQAMALIATGLAIGLIAALTGSRLLAHLLYDAQRHDALVLATSCSVLTLSGAIAAYFPARRAASIEPVRALRAE